MVCSLVWTGLRLNPVKSTLKLVRLWAPDTCVCNSKELCIHKKVPHKSWHQPSRCTLAFAPEYLVYISICLTLSLFPLSLSSFSGAIHQPWPCSEMMWWGSIMSACVAWLMHWRRAKVDREGIPGCNRGPSCLCGLTHMGCLLWQFASACLPCTRKSYWHGLLSNFFSKKASSPPERSPFAKTYWTAPMLIGGWQAFL